MCAPVRLCACGAFVLIFTMVNCLIGRIGFPFTQSTLCKYLSKLFEEPKPIQHGQMVI